MMVRLAHQLAHSITAFRTHAAITHAAAPVAEMDHLVATLKQSGLCKTAHYKELYLPQAEIEGDLSLSNNLPPVF